MPAAVQAPHPFDRLGPELILDAVERLGYLSDGRLLALNSYENRVYQIGIEAAEPIVVKFYRPERWSDAQIHEEHDFCRELGAHDLPVVAPLCDDDGNSLFLHKSFRYAIFPRKGGRSPDIDDLDNLMILGRLLGRIHLCGAQQAFSHRPTIDCQTFGHDAVTLIGEHFMPSELELAYASLTSDLLDKLDRAFDRADGWTYIRVHGDCHSGNILWRDDTPHFVDFDDARMAPAVQDIWMLLSGSRDRQTAQLMEILEGYEEFFAFPTHELSLVEPLRTLRLLHYNAWLAARWVDPAFPRTFTWFNTPRYWEQHILDLREQFAALDEEPLARFAA